LIVSRCDTGELSFQLLGKVDMGANTDYWR